MKAVLAWRILAHEPGRGALAVAGVWVAVMLVFLQLGLYASVPKGGMLHYDAMNFDLVVTAADYVSQSRSKSFPRRRLAQVQSNSKVAAVAPLYMATADWLNPVTRQRQDVFVIAFDPERPVFAVDSIDRQREILQRPDTVLVDDSTRPGFGVAQAGGRVEIAGREVVLGGSYTLGTGFAGLGVVLAGDRQFLRFFPRQDLADVSVGLVRLRPGADPGVVAEGLQRALPGDVLVMTRAELTEREVSYWTRRTSTGLVFGSAVVVGFLVGTVILYQTVASQIVRALPQYATLKAMGYGNGYLGGVVVRFAVLLAGLAYGPALLAALLVYAILRDATRLPVDMTAERAVIVLGASLAMAIGAALLSLRAVRRADPVDLF